MVASVGGRGGGGGGGGWSRRREVNVDNELWGKGEALEKGAKALEAQWKKLLAVENIVLHIDPEYTRPAIESLLGMFENQLRGYHNSLQFKWWTNAGDRKKVVTEHVDRGAPTA